MNTFLDCLPCFLRHRIEVTRCSDRVLAPINSALSPKCEPGDP